MYIRASSDSLRCVARLSVGVWVVLGMARCGFGDDSATAHTDVEFFEQQVAPILQAHCWKCHGAEKQQGGLRLDHRIFVLRGGDLGPAASIENPDDSNLLRAIRYEDVEMPPSGQLPEAQIEVLAEWIRRGVPWTPGEPPPEVESKAAPAEDAYPATPHWAYQPLQASGVPQVSDAKWARNPIDRFVLAKLEQRGLTPNPPASRQQLLRRLHFDLRGLPPRLVDVQAFAGDDRPDAYSAVVDQLLSHPQFGEKWGRHWLDLVRFAETNGYERDGTKANAWRYRDYVIAAFNDDLRYDRFVIEQLAGDELPDANTASRIATGYFRLGLWDDEPVDADQAYYDSLDDVVSTTGMAFLATTMGCARCHDHKIDPIPQRDYYRMLAFFHNIYRDSKQLQFKKTAFTLNTQTVIAAPQEVEAYRRQQEQLRDQIEQLRGQVGKFEERIVATFSNPEKDDAQSKEVRRRLIQERASSALSADELAEYQSIQNELRQLKDYRVAQLAEALTIKENGRVAPATFVLIRGNAHAQGEQVEPGFPSVLAGEPPNFPALPEDISSSGRRTAFARWLVDAKHPLTARVIVNRVWQHHFGRGLVRTSSDFGRYGAPPTHPELLDYLALQLIRHDWQLKWLHQLILNSQTYQMSSQDHDRGLEVDPENQLLWRFDMRRLTAEEIRDTVLDITGQLQTSMGGPSVYSKIPDEILQGASVPDAAWGKSSAAEQVRRSVYVFVKRSVGDPVLVDFDGADKDASCPVRFATTVPTQALMTLNGEFFNEQAAVLAARLKREVGDDPAEQVAQALRLALSREPTDTEVSRGVSLLDQWQTDEQLSPDQALRYFCLLVLNLNELIYID